MGCCEGALGAIAIGGRDFSISLGEFCTHRVEGTIALESKGAASLKL